MTKEVKVKWKKYRKREKSESTEKGGKYVMNLLSLASFSCVTNCALCENSFCMSSFWAILNHPVSLMSFSSTAKN